MNMDSEPQPDPQPIPIDIGLPASRDAWPPGVLDALKNFVQGHVVEKPPLFYFADPSRPVWARTFAYAVDSEGPEVVELSAGTGPTYGLITTQTCDIAEEDAERPIRPWVQVSPIYDRSEDLNSGWRRTFQRGGGPRYLMYVPALTNGFWVADFRIEIPVEKGWLATRSPIDGFGDEAAQRKVGERLAVLRNRPAFASRFVELIQRPLVEDLKKLKAENLHLYETMVQEDPEIAVELDSFLDPRLVRLTLLVERALSTGTEEWWRAWWDDASGRCEAVGLVLQPFAVREVTEVNLAEYRKMTTLPLARISSD